MERPGYRRLERCAVAAIYQTPGSGDDGTRTHDPLLAKPPPLSAVLTREKAGKTRANGPKLSTQLESRPVREARDPLSWSVGSTTWSTSTPIAGYALTNHPSSPDDGPAKSFCCTCPSAAALPKSSITRPAGPAQTYSVRPVVALLLGVEAGLCVLKPRARRASESRTFSILSRTFFCARAAGSSTSRVRIRSNIVAT